MLLDGKVAIVSGVGPGLGQAVARALGREGAHVVLAARKKPNLDAVADAIRDEGGTATVVPTNIVEPGDAQRLVDVTTSELGRIDVLVNNAFRMSSMRPFTETETATLRKIFEVNVFGALDLTRRAIPTMTATAAAHGDASIVFVSSQASRKANPPIHESDYAASKGAINTIVRHLAAELGPQQVRVNAVLPGWIGGPNVETYIAWQSESRGVDPEVVRSEIADRIALRRIPPQDEIARSIVFFASPWASVVTGQLLDVNGGEYMAP